MFKKVTIVTKLGDHFKVETLADRYVKPGTVLYVHHTMETSTVEVSFTTLWYNVRKLRKDLNIMNLCGIEGRIKS